MGNIKSNISDNELKNIIVTQLSEIEKMSGGNIIEAAKNSIELTIVFLSMDNRMVFFKLFIIFFFIVLFIALVDEKSKFREWKAGYWMLLPYVIAEFYIKIIYTRVEKNIITENGLIAAENMKYIIMIIFIIWGIKELNILLKTKRPIKLIRIIISAILLIAFPNLIFIFGAGKSFFTKNNKINRQF